MMMEILNREAELVKMANEKDTEIRQQEKEIEDKVNKKDSEKREFNWKLVGGISFALMTVVGISAGVLGGKLDLKLPMYRGELAISKIQYAKNESFCELKNQAEIYPGALKKSLINFFLFEAEFSLMCVKANAGAEDKYYIAGHVFRIVSCLNQVLFACNNAYCINEKKAIKLLETFEHKPEKYTEKVNHIFEVLGLSLFECYDMTEKLYKEVKKIATEINNFLNEESSDERKQI